MTISDLKQVIQDYFLDIYHKKYIGKIDIKKLDPVGYSIKLGMDNVYQPITIYAELEDSKFLKFLKQDLKDRRFNLAYWGKLNLREPYDCKPVNRACSCHDKGRIN